MNDDSMLTVTPGERIDVWTEHRLIRKDELADIRKQLATVTADRGALVEQLATVQAERDEAIKQRDMAIGQREESLYHWGADACSVRVREADLARWRGEATVLRQSLRLATINAEWNCHEWEHLQAMEREDLRAQITEMEQALAAAPLASASAAVVEAARRVSTARRDYLKATKESGAFSDETHAMWIAWLGRQDEMDAAIDAYLALLAQPTKEASE